MVEINPNHVYTLNAHLIFANRLWSDKSIDIDITKPFIKTKLEYILNNDLDKSGPRYMFSKEFIIRNF